MDDNKKRLVASIVDFLGDELNGDSLSPDARESLEGMPSPLYLDSSTMG